MKQLLQWIIKYLTGRETVKDFNQLEFKKVVPRTDNVHYDYHD